MLTGLLPALRVGRRDVQAACARGGAPAPAGPAAAAGGLVVTQLAVSLILLTGAGLLLRSLTSWHRWTPATARTACWS